MSVEMILLSACLCVCTRMERTCVCTKCGCISHPFRTNYSRSYCYGGCCFVGAHFGVCVCVCHLCVNTLAHSVNSFILAHSADCQYDSQLCVNSEIYPCVLLLLLHPPSFLPTLSPSISFFRSNRMTRSWLIVLMQIKSICITKTAASIHMKQRKQALNLVCPRSLYFYIYIFNEMLTLRFFSCSFKMSDYSTLWLNSHNVMTWISSVYFQWMNRFNS